MSPAAVPGMARTAERMFGLVDKQDSELETGKARKGMEKIALHYVRDRESAQRCWRGVEGDKSPSKVIREIVPT